MRIPALVLVQLSLLVLAAHLLRGGDNGLALSCLLMGALVLTRKGWVRPVVMALLALACFVWLDSAVEMVSLRQALGLPWTRLSLILGSVAALSFASFVLLGTTPGSSWFDRNREEESYKAAIFILTCAALLLARNMVPFPVLLGDRYFPGWGGLQIPLLGLYAVAVGGPMLDPKKAMKIRPRIWALFSMVFFLQLILGLSGLENMLMTGKLHLPVPALITAGPLFRGGGFFMLILLSATILLVGPAWCSHLCYIGAWDDAASRLSNIKADPDFPGKWRWARLGALVLTMGAALAMRLMGVPGGTAALLAAGFGLAGVGVMLAVSRKKGMMAHCTTYCPIGLVNNTMGKISPLRIRLNSECTRCGICSMFCRYGALTAQDIERNMPGPTCTLCGDCLGVCPHKAVEYRFLSLPPATARRLFLVLVVSLHAVFLAVARI